jgi:hypothetical protein
MTRVIFLSAFFLFSAQAALAAPKARLGMTTGVQQTDRSAVVFGPALELALGRDIHLRGEAQIEYGDLRDPFGENNLIIGPGPHVNHVLFGPVLRPEALADYAVAFGAEAGIMILHSIFAEREFTITPGAGLIAQAGRRLGKIELALQLRLDLGPKVAAADREGDDVPTTCGRAVLSFEVPLP